MAPVQHHEQSDQADISKCIPVIEIDNVLIQISLKFCSRECNWQYITSALDNGFMVFFWWRSMGIWDVPSNDS